MVFNFNDVNSNTNDLLNEDYTDKLSLKCKKNAGPIGVTIESSRNPKNGTLSTKIGSKFNISGISIDKLQLTQDANGVLETTLTPFANTKLGFVGNHKTADVQLEFQRNNLTASAILDVQDFQKFTSAAQFGIPNCGVTLATDAHFDLRKSQLSQINLGMNYTHGPIFASLRSINGLCFSKTCSSSADNKTSPAANLGLVYTLNPKLTIASNVLHNFSCHSNSCMTIGGLYKGRFGDVKLKANCCGVVSGALMKEVAPNVNVTLSTNVNVKDFSSIKYGLGVTI